MEPFASVLTVLVLFSAVSASPVFEDPSLAKFLSTLEEYEIQENDVVFVLDESGSIGAERFVEVKLFTKFMARRLHVSSEYSRIALVPYSSSPREYSNYIKNSYGNNMCTLVREVDQMNYLGGGTATGTALIKARDLLVQARSSSNKIIVLITDGQSNEGSSPETEAAILKNNGVIIFTIGVADVNREEVVNVATSLNHVYILTNFSYIRYVNEHFLTRASNDVNWDTVSDTALCNGFCSNGADCCDQHARCNCGTQSGFYECVCDAGYYGNGHKNNCHKCPIGTYKGKVGNSDCLPCPEHSTTQEEGAISSSQCHCQVGYHRDGKTCKAIECAMLRAPLGGVLIPSNCSNTFGSKCALRCQEGYCPHSCGPSDLAPWNRLPLQFRICLETGKWSGEPFHCQAMKCPVINHPLFGEHNCSGSDFQFGTTCRFACKDGYQLTGSDTRHCLVNGSWTGTEAVCEEILCDLLKMNPNLKIKPVACSQRKMKFNSVCQYYCIEGFSLTSYGKVIDGKHICLANKTWSGVKNDISCQDKSPPVIKCPKEMEIKTDPHKSSAVVAWKDPTAKDNVFISSVTIKEPYFLRKPFTLPIGTTKIVYEAFDSAGLSNSCSFLVTVVDKEPPSVANCPQDIQLYHTDNKGTEVRWDEPIFSDNSGKVNVVSINRKSGTRFSLGSSNVSYIVEDPSGNKAFCNFSVILKSFRCPVIKAPENGIVSCDNFMDGQFCRVVCKEGYRFALAEGMQLPEAYFCARKMNSKSVRWKPFPFGSKLKVIFPIPDCSRIQKRSAINASVNMKFDVDTCSKEYMEKIKKEFIDILKREEKKYKGMICPEHKGCKAENVNVNCTLPGKIVKRSVREDTTGKKASLVVSFNVQIHPNGSESVRPLKKGNGGNTPMSLLKEIEKQVSLSVKDVYHLPTSPSALVIYDLVRICSVGQININDSCVTCPAGTYKILDSCVDCPIATYQNSGGNLRCLPCPKDYTTYGKRSKSKDDCKAPCKPGSYSKTTFEPCQQCPLNTYQEYSHGKECLKCPSGLQTWRVGTNSRKECTEPCSPGSYSGTGLEPCTLCGVGSYQNDSQQKLCNPCPENTTTTTEGASSSAECNVYVCRDQCLQGSVCIPQQNSYICMCVYGTYGKHCEMSVDPCDEVTCANNGTCESFSGNYTCRCLEGFEGNSCEINTDDCSQGFCKNGGKCIDLINGYSCECQVGFTGPQCEVNADDCASNPCLNGGICTDKVQGFTCCCPPGYAGSLCEEREDLCENVERLNGGSCITNNSHVTCACMPGLTGKNCEINIDDCINYECLNNGVCVDGIAEASCQCPLMYSGKHCESEASPIYHLEFNTPMTTNFVKLENSRVLYAITLSFLMRSSYKNNSPTPVSYSYHDLENDVIVDNALTLFDINRMILYLHGQLLHTDYVANKDSNWHHYAVTWEGTEGLWSFYVDGKIVVNGQNVGKEKYFYPGVFVLGQEQDSLGGTFSTSEAFVGDITEFNVWDYAMTQEEIMALSLHCGHVGNIIPWIKAVNHVQGTVNIRYDVDVCKSIGSCSSNDCHCLFSDRKSDYLCKHSVQSCTPNPCSNNQKCISEEARLFCECVPGYEGKYCEIDKNECLLNNGNCSHHCDNSIGSYDCSCPDGMFLSEDGFTCKETKFCEKDGRIYLDGETFVSECQTCTCGQGVLTCQEEKCLSTQCFPEEHLVLNPGSCCPKCVSYAFCVITEENRITAFDSSQVEVPNHCSFKLFEDCTSGLYSVRYEFLSNNSHGNLYLLDSCTQLHISPTGSILLNDDSIHLPFKNQVFSIESADGVTEIRSQSGLYVKWQLNGDIIVAVPTESVPPSCGLCGSYQFYNSTCDGGQTHHFGSSLVRAAF